MRCVRPLLLTATVALAAMTMLPAAVAQSPSPVGLVIFVGSTDRPAPDGMVVNETYEVPVKVELVHPPASPCLERRPVDLSVRADPAWSIALTDQHLDFPPTVDPFTQPYHASTSLLVTASSKAAAWKAYDSVVTAQGGGCESPYPMVADGEANQYFGVFARYEPGVEVRAAEPVATGVGTYRWDLTFVNQANGETRIEFDGSRHVGGVFIQNLPEAFVLGAVQVPDSDPQSKTVSLRLERTTEEGFSAALRYTHGYAGRSPPGSLPDPIAVVPLVLPPGPLPPPSQPYNEEALEAIPALEIIPLSMALAGATLLAGRRRRG